MNKKQIEAHGKIDSDSPTMLEQIWGFNELSKYGTLDEEEYKKTLTELSKGDLQSHARDMGIVPIDNAERLLQNCLREFRNYVTYLKKPTIAAVRPKAPSKAIKDILAEGR
jgi:hypothetical protein